MFVDRTDAGRRLAERLASLAPLDPVVLAIPRGGVPVAVEVARALGAPLDLVLVRKIGAPGQPELAVAAVSDGGAPQLVVNDRVARILELEPEWLAAETAEKLREIEARRRVLLAGRDPVGLAGRTVVVVDDGIATGTTTRAVLRSVRAAGPREVILAVPVAAPDTLDALRGEVDRIECLLAPSSLGAISAYYRDFRQVSDAEVRRLLETVADGARE